MDSEPTVLGVVVAVVGVIGSVLVARVSNPGPREQQSPAAAAPPPAADPLAADSRARARDLTTIAGIAEVLAEQGREITTLQERQAEHAAHARRQDLTIRALRRWAQALESALRATGATVPEPATEDAEFIRG